MGRGSQDSGGMSRWREGARAWLADTVQSCGLQPKAAQHLPSRGHPAGWKLPSQRDPGAPTARWLLHADTQSRMP